ncbi:piwi-like protein 1 isoform X2 [Physella acuta]|uniref:piwi-like protein 1 isoform X2 n=1 Tax=Physella acuta TaxID=109671 RepID=UPI0027DD09E1|nr:piwi-like protein 1 isoform X2 [Physella acuta]
MAGFPKDDSDMIPMGRARGRGGRNKKFPVDPEPPLMMPENPAAGDAMPLGSSRGRARGRKRTDESEPLVGNKQVAAADPVYTPASTSARRELSPTEDLSRLSLRTRRTAFDQYIDHPWKDEGKDTVGKSGDHIMLYTNYFEVNLGLDQKIFQYHVSFKPEVENVRVKFQLITSLTEVVGTVRCFDGGILYLQRLLPREEVECVAPRAHDGTLVTITIKYICEIHKNTPQFLQIANLMFKKSQMALDMKKIRDHYFNLKLAIKIPKHRIEVMPGFATSILNYDGGNLLGIDIIHKVLRFDTFLDALYLLFESSRRNTEEFHKRAIKELVGSIVMTRYNNKTYRVDDINWNARATDTFEKNGEQMSYIQYYQQHWNITVKDSDQPLLVTRPTERDKRRGQKTNLYLVPELCVITGLSDQLRSDYNVMKDLAAITRIGPTDRLKQIQRLCEQLNQSEKVGEILRPWKIEISDKPAKIPARQLPAERLLMKTNRGEITKISYDSRKADWSRNMRNISLLNSVNMDQWVIIFPYAASQPSAELSETFTKVGKGMGMRIVDPVKVQILDDRNDSYLQAIRQNLNPRVQMVVCVVPNSKKDRYDAIKKCCCIDNPVPSQVVILKTLQKKQGLMSVATKIAIQMNCKMGGEVWGAEIPLKGLMVIGIDTYHDSAHKNQSVGALVASLNKECTRYYSKTEYHPTKDELMRNLQPLMKGALEKYYEVNGAMPQKIVLYRDGVGDGQLYTVYKSEFEQIMSAFAEVGVSNSRPGFAFVVVKKRLNTRLFKLEGDCQTNPPPGTIVDQFITKPNWYDFFIVSQSITQGTVSPTNYNVIFDDTGLQPDHIQKLTFKLCHLYFNWQGTIRVPAVCMYAHKLAFLQGQSLHREFSKCLSDKLFYL